MKVFATAPKTKVNLLRRGGGYDWNLIEVITSHTIASGREPIQAAARAAAAAAKAEYVSTLVIPNAAKIKARKTSFNRRFSLKQK